MKKAILKYELLCKFDTRNSCPLKQTPRDLECIGCSLSKIADELHAEDGIYRHYVQLSPHSIEDLKRGRIK